jgi:hypothetical protein
MDNDAGRASRAVRDAARRDAHGRRRPQKWRRPTGSRARGAT